MGQFPISAAFIRHVDYFWVRPDSGANVPVTAQEFQDLAARTTVSKPVQPHTCQSAAGLREFCKRRQIEAPHTFAFAAKRPTSSGNGSGQPPSGSDEFEPADSGIDFEYRLPGDWEAIFVSGPLAQVVARGQPGYPEMRSTPNPDVASKWEELLGWAWPHDQNPENFTGAFGYAFP